ncbi:TPM domain-containing protein [Clostridium sp. D33t1_170424_F3]|uniref:TPM domain-containing protein n=1 Tax=Clostridium sp. D33t1_170424_F3 TaxID=2787099 RepID=UPI0018A90C80|nr:TPM domain-containing protein [Clostridium sp. D33t1_170424_F3]
MRVRITGGVLAFFLLITVCCGGWTAFAAEKKVYDQAGLFSADSAVTLDARASALTRKLESDFIIVTTDDARGKTPQDYADDFYDENGFGVGEDQTGALFLIDMDNRQVYISTSGKAIAYLTDSIIDGLLDDSVGYLKRQDYDGAASHFLDRMEKLFPSGDPMPGEKEPEYVFDQVGLLLPNQLLSLESDAATLSKSLQMDLVIVTADDTEGKPSQTYADTFFQSNGFGQGDGKSGALFLIDVANRQVTLSTSGRASRLLTTEKIQAVLDRVAPMMETQDYNGAVQSFLNTMREFVRPETKYVVDPARLLTSEQLVELNEEAEEMSRRWDVDIIMVYTDDLQGESIQSYTDRIYDEGNYRSKAVLLVYHLNDGAVYEKSRGGILESVTKESPVMQSPMRYLEKQDYVGAVKSYLEESEKELTRQVRMEEVRRKERERQERQRQREQRFQILLAIGSLVSLAGGFIAVQIARSGYKARAEKEEEKQQRGGALHLTVDEDVLVNTYTTSRYIPPPPPPSSHSGGGSSGGGSSFGGGSSGFGGSTHTSSGGATHGGGGRGF